MSYDPTALSGGGGSWEKISTTVLSNQATADFVLTGTYKMYRFQLKDVVPTVDVTELRLKMSVDGGSNFLEDFNQYISCHIGETTSGTIEDELSSTFVLLSSDHGSGNMGTGATESLNGVVNVHNAKQAANSTVISSDIVVFGQSAAVTGIQSYALLRANIDAVDAIRFYPESGNLSTGEIVLYGLKLS